MSSAYDELRRQFPDLSLHITGSEDRGNASHGNRPLDGDVKATWLPDLAEEYADALVYLTLEIRKEAKRKIRSSAAYARWLDLRAQRRAVADLLAGLGQLQTDDEPPKRSRRAEVYGPEHGGKR